MVTSALASLSKRTPHHKFILCALALSLCSCVVVPPATQQKIEPATPEGSLPPERRISPPGTNPAETKPTSNSSEIDKILSQMPKDSRESDSEISIPISAFDGPQSTDALDERGKRLRDAHNRRTDNEITGSTRSIDERKPREIGELDKSLEVAPTEKPGASPSYVSTVQKIKDQFKRREYENALVETNEALRYYPRSAQLLTMKGTLYQRLNHLELALSAYERAYDIEPSRKLLAQMEHLRNILNDRASIAAPRSTLVPPGDATKHEAAAKGVP